MADASIDKLKTAIKEILKDADLDSLSTKIVRKMLEDKFSADFSKRKKEIDKLVMKMIDTDNAVDEGQVKPNLKRKESEKSSHHKHKKHKEADKGQESTKPRQEAQDERRLEAIDNKETAVATGRANPNLEGDTDTHVPEKTLPQSSKSKKRKSAGKADDSEDPVMCSIRQIDDEDLAKKLQEEELAPRRRRAAAPFQPLSKAGDKDFGKKKQTKAIKGDDFVVDSDADD